MIRIDIPATSANLGSGFDSLGIALTMCNRVWMEEADELKITTTDKIKCRPMRRTSFTGRRGICTRSAANAAGSAYHSGNNIPMARWSRQFFGVHVAGILGANRMLGLADVAERPH